MNELPPLLIARQKNAKILKDDYKLGWLFQDKTGYYWMGWGSSSNLENAMNVARQIIKERGNRTVYLSETPLERNVAVYEMLPKLKEINLNGIT